jgi:hypothetical protein
LFSVRLHDFAPSAAAGDSDEYQALYQSFTEFQLAAILEAQHQISEILIKYFEEST